MSNDSIYAVTIKSWKLFPKDSHVAKYVERYWFLEKKLMKVDSKLKMTYIVENK